MDNSTASLSDATPNTVFTVSMEKQNKQKIKKIWCDLETLSERESVGECLGLFM